MKKTNSKVFGLIVIGVIAVLIVAMAAFRTLVALAALRILRGQEGTEVPLQNTTTEIDTVLSREDTINAMAMAFALQESEFDHTAVSPCGQWVGCLQLSEIMVNEANRLVGFDCFNYSDRFDRQGSYAIFKIVMENRNKNLKIDRAIDLWNPNCPTEYRDNVKKYFLHNLQNYNTLEDYFLLK